MLYMLPSRVLYNPYHLLPEPEESIKFTSQVFFLSVFLEAVGLPQHDTSAWLYYLQEKSQDEILLTGWFRFLDPWFQWLVEKIPKKNLVGIHPPIYCNK